MNEIASTAPESAAAGSVCFHCGLDAPADERYAAVVGGERRNYCCLGCQAVSQAIYEAGLQGFYSRIPAAGLQAPPPPPPPDLEHFDLDAVQEEFVDDLGEVRGIHLLVEGIHCAACVWLIERSMERLPGIVEANVNLAEKRLHVRWRNSEIRLSQILARLGRIGYAAVPFDAETAEGALRRRNRELLYRMAFAGFTMMNLLWISIALYAGANTGQFRSMFHWVGFALATPTLLYSGWPFLSGAVRALRNLHLSMDLPIAIGATIAYGYSSYVTVLPGSHGGVYFDTVVNFLFVILVGRYLEAISRQHAVASTRRLVELQPRVATVVKDGAEELTSIRAVRPGDIVLVRPGQTIPVDGTVLEGEGAVNEAMLTGESQPVAKRPDATVAAGTVNLSGALRIRAEHLLRDTALGRIIRMVEDAQASRAPIQSTADRIVPWFVAATLALAALTFAWWVQRDFDTALLATVAVLIITCPCAFGLATPMAVAVASGLGARHGILIKSGAALEALSRIDHVVFDKTGTLTTGHMRLAASYWADNDEARCLGRLAAVERLSEHGIARAVVDAAESGQAPDRDAPVEAFGNRPGLGVSGRVQGTPIVAGNAAWLDERRVAPNPLVREQAAAMERRGLTCLHCAVDGREAGVLGIADQVREDAGALLARLRRRGVRLTLLTGDRRAVAEAVADDLGGLEVCAQVLPEDKAKVIAALQAKGERVAMVGDGVNDAPALVQADVGIAMASGTDVSADSADVVLMGDRLDHIVLAGALARRALRAIHQNIGLSLTYNAIMVPLAMTGWVTPLVAAIAMPISSLLVIGNAARIRTLFRGHKGFVAAEPRTDTGRTRWTSSMA